MSRLFDCKIEVLRAGAGGVFVFFEGLDVNRMGKNGVEITCKTDADARALLESLARELERQGIR